MSWKPRITRPLDDGAATESRPGRLSERLMDLIQKIRGESIELGAIVNLMGLQSIGLVLLVLALPMALPIPTPGLSILFGVPLVLISAQMAFGRCSIWLPAALSKKRVRRSALLATVNRALPLLRHLEAIIRPRLSCLTKDWMRIPIGAACFLLAVIIALPIPLGHVIPGIAICVLVLGLMEHDGLVIGIGVFVATIAVAVVIAALHGIGVGLHTWTPLATR